MKVLWTARVALVVGGFVGGVWLSSGSVIAPAEASQSTVIPTVDCENARIGIRYTSSKNQEEPVAQPVVLCDYTAVMPIHLDAEALRSEAHLARLTER